MTVTEKMLDRGVAAMSAAGFDVTRNALCAVFQEMSLADRPTPAEAQPAVAIVCGGWAIHWLGDEPIATLLARHPNVRIGTKLYATAPPAVPMEVRELVEALVRALDEVPHSVFLGQQHDALNRGRAWIGSKQNG